MPTWLAIMLIFAIIWATCAVVVYGWWLRGSPGAWMYLALMATIAIAANSVSVASARRRTAARQVRERADFEHHAIERGHVGLGLYGRYQPPDIR